MIECSTVTQTILVWKWKVVENSKEKWDFKYFMVVLCFEILMAFAVGAFSSGVRGGAGGGGGGGDGGGRKLFSKIKDKARLQIFSWKCGCVYKYCLDL